MPATDLNIGTFDLIPDFNKMEYPKNYNHFEKDHTK